MTEKFRNRWWF